MMNSAPPVRLNERKVTQAGARFIAASGGTIDHIKLVKLMYLLERRALVEWGHPVLNDVYFSLKNGPIPSGVCDLINSTDTFWSKSISKEPKNLLRLIKAVGDDELSAPEKRLIDELSETHRNASGPDMIRYTHGLKEWENPEKAGKGRLPIAIASILEAAKKSPEAAKAVEDEIRARRIARSLFS